MLEFISVVAGTATAFVHHQKNPEAPLWHSAGVGLGAAGLTYGVGKLFQAVAEELGTVAFLPMPDVIDADSSWDSEECEGRAVRMFFSYHHERDQWAKDMLAEAAEAGAFGWAVEDISIRKNIRTERSSQIQGYLTRSVRSADVVAIVVGEDTAERKWVSHEVETAKDSGIPTMAIKLRREFRAPSRAYGSGTEWAGYSVDSIESAMDRALAHL